LSFGILSNAILMLTTTTKCLDLIYIKDNKCKLQSKLLLEQATFVLVKYFRFFLILTKIILLVLTLEVGKIKVYHCTNRCHSINLCFLFFSKV